jgi:hypothetical protein
MKAKKQVIVLIGSGVIGVAIALTHCSLYLEINNHFTGL